MSLGAVLCVSRAGSPLVRQQESSVPSGAEGWGQGVGSSAKVRAIVASIVLAAACLTRTWCAPVPHVFTSARAAHDLTRAEAQRGYPVHLRTTVTYYDPFIDIRHAALFVCDSTACI